MSPSVWTDVLAEFRSRVAPATYNAQHPGSFSYFTPPPLPSSIAGEVLSQWIHQGVDVWHAGPIGTFVEEEVTAWLRDLVGFGQDGWGVLTSGGVMANIMAMTVARDVWLVEAPRHPGPPRGGPARGRACVRERPDALLDRAGARCARVPRRHARGDRQRRAVPAAGGAGGRGDRARPGGRADPARDRGGGGLDEHRLGRRHPRARRRRRARRRVAARRRRLRRGGSALDAAMPTGCPGSSEPTASRSIRTSGSSRPTTSGRWSCADARTC